VSEIHLSLDQADPAILWGTNNEHFEILKKRFPKLKIVARGTQVKVLGDEQETAAFAAKFEQLLQHLEKYNRISSSDFEQILNAEKDSPGEGSDAAREIGLGDVILYGPKGNKVRARSENQLRMVEGAYQNDILFAIGPAGTGKTYTAVALAVRALKNKEVKRIILTRPAVEAGENLGFLPGDLKEKIDPYLRPLYDALDDMIPQEKLRVYLENRTIEVAPLAFMRGRTLDNAFVILDEAQNATDLQLKMFLTRMGPTAKFIVTGDVTQIDLPRKQQSGLLHAMEILKNIRGIEFVYLNGNDVVRHKLVRKILEAYGDIEKQ